MARARDRKQVEPDRKEPLDPALQKDAPYGSGGSYGVGGGFNDQDEDGAESGEVHEHAKKAEATKGKG